MENRAPVLLILPEDVLSRARVLAGKAMVKLKLPVSLQITLRALIEEGLRRQNRPSILSNIEAHAKAVRHTRRLARLGMRSGAPGGRAGASRPRTSGSGPRAGRK